MRLHYSSREQASEVGRCRWRFSQAEMGMRGAIDDQHERDERGIRRGRLAWDARRGESSCLFAMSILLSQVLVFFPRYLAWDAAFPNANEPKQRIITGHGWRLGL